jgi:hypothetical protein
VIPSTAYIKFWPGGSGEVDASLRLTGKSDILCHSYDDRPAILSIRDAHVSVTVTVPDSGQVTAEDVATARRLADAVARYIADLERRLSAEVPAEASVAA